MNIEIHFERARRSPLRRLHDSLIGKLNAGERKPHSAITSSAHRKRLHRT